MATAPTPTSATLLESSSPTGNLRALTTSDPPTTSAQWVTPAFITTDPETPAPSSQATPTALTLATPTLRTVTTPTALTLATPTLRTVTTPTALTLATPTLRTVTTPTALTLATPTLRTVTTPTALTLATPTLRTVTTPTALTLATPTLRTVTTPTSLTLATPITQATPLTVSTPTSIDLRTDGDREAVPGGGGRKAGGESGDRTAEQKPSGCWFEGLVFEEGSVFSPDSSSCLLCSCEAGRLACLRAVCPLHPDLTALDEGQCCPTCPECQLTSDPICRANGMRFRNGTMFRREDCSECTCTAGELVCEPVRCPPLSCSPSLAVTPKGQCCPQCPGPQGCVHRGQLHQQGALWCDGCAVCECEGSEVRCQPNPCPPLQTCLEEQDLIEAERVCCQQRETQHYTGVDVCCPSASPES
ncbi:von Willebrand factor C and EGF domain-containing protein-like isoform X1 [Huso huso]|uniref:von Willebrand factor C and EGF domain-containing protein-like isoform X1 n=1 Tax=Huso huso TaxID=61971 RepID=A0ABR0YKD9_HUSHU